MKNSLQAIDRLTTLAKHLYDGVLFTRFYEMPVPEFATEDEPPILELEEGIAIAFFTFPINELPYIFEE